MPEISSELITRVKEWLGNEGSEFFKKVKKDHGTLIACWDEGGIPHPVHFREGMQVRNFLRTSGLCQNWTDHDFDENWVAVIEKSIEPEVVKLCRTCRREGCISRYYYSKDICDRHVP